MCREFLEILPRLQPGVWVHVHDIFFPARLSGGLADRQRLACNEQYLLEAFLAFNRAFSARACAAHWLWSDYRDDARGVLACRASSTRSASTGPPASGWHALPDSRAVDAGIAVVIATVGRADALAGCLESLASQSHRPAEIIVVHSGGDSDTRALCERDWPSRGLDGPLSAISAKERGAAA